MVQPTIHTGVKLKLDIEELSEGLRVKVRSPLLKNLNEMVLKVEQIAKPKAIILPVSPQINKERSVSISELEFSSRILKINLEQATSVFAVIVTAGCELEQWKALIKDILFKYWADYLADEVLQQTARYADNVIKTLCKADFVSWMTPGSLEDWPISQQENLFALFNGKNDEIGVGLTKNYIMQPLKSLSGFVFSSKKPFFSCQLCKKEKCNKRRANFDIAMAEELYDIKQ